MTPTQVASTVTEIQTASNLILTTIEGLDPAVALPAETAGTIVNLLADLAAKALAAFVAAQGTPITDASIAATLTPDATPLSAPDATPLSAPDATPQTGLLETAPAEPVAVPDATGSAE